jgi:hypothetical protein
MMAVLKTQGLHADPWALAVATAKQPPNCVCQSHESYNIGKGLTIGKNIQIQ